MTYRSPDPGLEASTNKWMAWGLAFMIMLIVGFVAYLWFEPTARADSLEEHTTVLAEMGAELYDVNCASCHGADGEGGIGPALNSQEFLTAAKDDQITAIITVGRTVRRSSANWATDREKATRAPAIIGR